ncbi:MAG TPA: phosphatase PAP2 family protein [Deinococcales bacterium]|nr:phosphatase PAP2 family protein [Deinococcales bacterium]
MKPTWKQRLQAVPGAETARLLGLFVAVLLPTFAFGRLADGVWEHEGFAFDNAILHAVHRLATPSRDALMVFITQLGATRGLLPVAVCLILGFAFRRAFASLTFLVIAAGGAVALNLVLKVVFHRHRPNLWLSPAPETDFGFPSGHAMATMALVAAVIIVAWGTRWRWPALVVGGAFVLAVGLSRVYLGVHFPSDVLAGWAASLSWVFGTHAIMHWRPAGNWRHPTLQPPRPGAHPSTTGSTQAAPAATEGSNDER